MAPLHSHYFFTIITAVIEVSIITIVAIVTFVVIMLAIRHRVVMPTKHLCLLVDAARLE